MYTCSGAGRASASFGSSDSFLPVVLGPPENWRQATASKDFQTWSPQRLASGRGGNDAEKFRPLQQVFRYVQFTTISDVEIKVVSHFRGGVLRMNSRQGVNISSIQRQGNAIT